MSEIAITVGLETVGYIVERDKRQHEAQDHQGRRLGTFPNQKDAHAAIFSAWTGRPTA